MPPPIPPPDVPPPGGVGIGRGAEYEVDDEGGAGGAGGASGRETGAGAAGLAAGAGEGRGGVAGWATEDGAAGRGGLTGRAAGGVVVGRATGAGAGRAVGMGGRVAGVGTVGRATGARAAEEAAFLGAAGRADAAFALAFLVLFFAVFLAVFFAAFFAPLLAVFFALFLAVFFPPVLRFLALPLRAAGRALLRAAALREPFLALFFLALRFGPPPRAAWARFMAAVAARFMFFRVLAAPELRFLLDFAMIVPLALPRRQLWTKPTHNKTHHRRAVA